MTDMYRVGGALVVVLFVLLLFAAGIAIAYSQERDDIGAVNCSFSEECVNALRELTPSLPAPCYSQSN